MGRRKKVIPEVIEEVVEVVETVEVVEVGVTEAPESVIVEDDDGDIDEVVEVEVEVEVEVVKPKKAPKKIEEPKDPNGGLSDYEIVKAYANRSDDIRDPQTFYGILKKYKK